MTASLKWMIDSIQIKYQMQSLRCKGNLDRGYKICEGDGGREKKSVWVIAEEIMNERREKRKMKKEKRKLKLEKKNGFRRIREYKED